MNYKMYFLPATPTEVKFTDPSRTTEASTGAPENGRSAAEEGITMTSINTLRQSPERSDRSILKDIQTLPWPETVINLLFSTNC